MVFDRKEYYKKYNEKNKEKHKKNKQKYYIKNKQKIDEKNKEYRDSHKESFTEYKREWKKTEVGKKSDTISSWKRRGLKLFGYTYEEVYDYYLDCHKCEVCDKDISGRQKCMDHSHDTGIFRWVLCKSCNTKDSWMNKI